MGNVCGPSDPESKTNREIDKALEKEKEWLQDEIKLLLLGTGESGKSTVFKQMKILQVDGGFLPEELSNYKRIVLSNTLNQMKVLITAAARLGIELERPDIRSYANKISQMDGYAHWNAEAGAMIAELWKDRGILQAASRSRSYENRNQYFQLDDSASYMFDNVLRFCDNNYEPTHQDVLRARSRTTGIEEANFHFNDIDFRLIDVGGQRSERRKWVHQFEGVTAVIFCVSLSEYDQVLREDPTQNRTRESLLLFDEINNSPWFKRTPFIIFFNKIDLLKEKIARVPLTSCFKDYNGGANVEAAKKFIAERFLELNTSQHKIYHHFTCAIDPSNMDVVFALVRKTMIEDFLRVSGL